MTNQGTVCLMVGYAVDHDGDCYEMWDPEKGTVHVTRDVVWLKKMYYKEQQGEETLVLEPARVEMVNSTKSMSWEDGTAEKQDEEPEVIDQKVDEIQGETDDEEEEEELKERVTGRTRYG